MSWALHCLLFHEEKSSLSKALVLRIATLPFERNGVISLQQVPTFLIPATGPSLPTRATRANPKDTRYDLVLYIRSNEYYIIFKYIHRYYNINCVNDSTRRSKRSAYLLLFEQFLTNVSDETVKYSIERWRTRECLFLHFAKCATMAKGRC